MCWASALLEPGSSQRDSQIGSSRVAASAQSPDLSSDLLDESLLENVPDTAILDAWCGDQLDLLDQLLKQETADVGFGDFNTKPQPAPVKPEMQRVYDVKPTVPFQLPVKRALSGSVRRPVENVQQPMMMMNGMQPMMGNMHQQCNMMPQQAPVHSTPQPQMQQAQPPSNPTAPVPNLTAAAQAAAMMNPALASIIAGQLGQQLNTYNPPVNQMNQINPWNQMMQMAQIFSGQNGMPGGMAGKMNTGKLQSDIDESTERVKKKRRESAQRSRARKNAHMKTLEAENKVLRDENLRLKQALAKYCKEMAPETFLPMMAWPQHHSSASGSDATSKSIGGGGCDGSAGKVEISDRRDYAI